MLNGADDDAPFNAETHDNLFGSNTMNNGLSFNSDIANGTMLSNPFSSDESPNSNFQQNFSGASSLYQPGFANNLGIYTPPAYKPDFDNNDGSFGKPIDIPFNNPAPIMDTAQSMFPMGGSNAFSMSPGESNMATGEMASPEPAFSAPAPMMDELGEGMA